MKKLLLAVLLILALSTSAFAVMTLDLVYSNASGSGTYGALQLEQTAINVVTFSANYNPAVFTPIAGSFGVMDVYLNLSSAYSGGTPTLIQLTNQNSYPHNSWIVTEPSGGAHANQFGYTTLNATGGGNSDERIPIAASTDPVPFTPLFSLSGTGLTVDDFVAFSKDNHANDTQWIAAMHLAGYDRDGSRVNSEFLGSPVPITGDSAFLGSPVPITGDGAFLGSPVPIPGTVYLFGSGLVVLVGIARRRMRKK